VRILRQDESCRFEYSSRGAVRRARRKAQEANGASVSLVYTAVHAVKERILRLFADLGPIYLNSTQAADRYQNLAA
jgi:hypothetical protein